MYLLPDSLDTRLALPLSFQAETHHKRGSEWRRGYVARKYSKKSGAISRSSAMKKKTKYKIWLKEYKYINWTIKWFMISTISFQVYNQTTKRLSILK